MTISGLQEPIFIFLNVGRLLRIEHYCSKSLLEYFATNTIGWLAHLPYF